MSISKRIHDTIEDWQAEWKDRLRGWAGRFISEGIRSFTDNLEPDFLEDARETLGVIRDTPGMPPEIRRMIERSMREGNILWTVLAQLMMIIQSLGLILAGSGPLGRQLEYLQDRIKQTYRFDPAVVVQIARRFKEKYPGIIEDLKDQGFSDEYIKALFDVTLFYPSPQDLVNWQAKEVYEPEMRAKYGLDDEVGELKREPFYMAGMDDKQIDNFWAAHWEHASYIQMVELLHRGLLTGSREVPDQPVTKEGWAARDAQGMDELYRWYRLVEIAPIWRNLLSTASWNVPTRVDVRRWYDMRTIGEEELYSIYHRQGYRGKDLDNYVLWTKVYTDFPVLMARWKNGWITLEEVRQRLITLGMPPERVEELIQEKVKAEGPDRTVKERDVTKSDIYKGVKQGRITRDQGIELLQELGFDEDEAEYLIFINIPPDEEDSALKKRTLTKSDISSAVKEQIITPAQAIDRLIDLRYSPADAEFLSVIYASQIPIEKVEKQRELTKGDITKALKKGIIGPSEAKIMLLTLRYSAEDAQFLIDTNMPSEDMLEEEDRRKVSKTDIKSAWRTGILTSEGAYNKLIEIGYSADDASFLMSIYETLEKLSHTTRPKDATKADIVLGVKKGLITPEEGYLMLLGIDYTPEAANFILSVRVETSPFSPINYEEFRQMTDSYRRVVGIPVTSIEDRLRDKADELVKVKGMVEELEKKLDELTREVVDLKAIPTADRELIEDTTIALNRARSNQERIQNEYNDLVARFKKEAK